MKSISIPNYTRLSTDLDAIRRALADEESIDIYHAYYLSLLKGNQREITQSISRTIGRRIGTDLLTLLEQKKNAGAKLVIFCCGALGKRTLCHLQNTGIVIDAFCDNNSAYWGTCVEEIPVISPDALLQWKGNVFILIATNVPAYLLPIEIQIKKLGFAEREDWLSTSTFEEMYFPALLPIDEGEVLADCGAYNGDESLALTQKTNGHYRHIYLVEPDYQNMRRCKEKLAGHDKITFIEACVMNQSGEIGFSSAGHQGSQIYLQSEQKIPCIAMDDVMENPAPTYIKMDLEGAELAALTGAATIISQHKPKLAVSIYHKPEDIFTLPSLLLQLYPGYRFFLRYQSFSDIDTVLYALP